MEKIWEVNLWSLSMRREICKEDWRIILMSLGVKGMERKKFLGTLKGMFRELEGGKVFLKRDLNE